MIFVCFQSAWRLAGGKMHAAASLPLLVLLVGWVSARAVVPAEWETLDSDDTRKVLGSRYDPDTLSLMCAT